MKKVQSEVLQLWKNIGYSTYATIDGDNIISYNALSREGKEPYGYEFTKMTPESPYFKIKTDSEIGSGNRNAYLALSNPYERKPDPGDKGTPTYTYRDKENYVRLLYTATKERKQTAAGKPRTGDTQCGVLWKNGGVSEMSRAHFKKVSTENGKKAIEICSMNIGVPFPWDIDPKGV